MIQVHRTVVALLRGDRVEVWGDSVEVLVGGKGLIEIRT